MLLIAKILLVFGAVVISLMISLGVTWIWLSCERIPNLISPGPKLSFDYIIVGAGTSGSALAHELSRNSNISILLIEAGHVFSPISKVPLLSTILQQTNYDWKFESVPQKYSSFGLYNQIQFHPRGKGLGGSSQINFMLHFGGNQKDFERWNIMGIKGWSMRYQKRPNTCSQMVCKSSLQSHVNQRFIDYNVFRHDSLTDENNKTEEVDLIWTLPKNYSPISEAFMKASRIFEKDDMKFQLSKYSIRNGIRWGSYEKYLRPAFDRHNLKIMTNTMVKKITIRNGKAQGVMIKNENFPSRKLEIAATKEVIISAGAFQTPQLLQISGIGPKRVLDNIGVKQIFNSKYVGSNLHDHFPLALFASINVTASITVGKILNLREVFKYLIKGTGHFSNFGVIGTVTSDRDNTSVTLFGTGAIDDKVLMDISNFKKEVFRSIFPLYHNSSQEGFVILTTCLQPQSRGIVKARSSNIEDPPLINPRHLQKTYDIKCMIKSIRKAVKIIKSEPFQQINAHIHWPMLRICSKYGPLNRDFYTNEPSDKYLECVIRTGALTGHHPGGTCSMGANPDSVLDNNLRVRGVNHLRVADASVLPTPVSGTPNAVLEAIGKRAAQLIEKYS